MDRKIEFQLMEIAPALTLEEAADYCGVDLEELNKEDTKWFKRAYAKGKHELKIQAVEALRADMKLARDKTKPALSVLLRFAEEWNVVEGENDVNSGAKISIDITGKNP